MKKLFALLCVIALLGALCVPAMAATGRVAVAAQVPDDWTTPHLYAWGGTDEVAWPGVPMVMVDDWYVAYMSDDHPNIIINNGNGGAQTSDLTVTVGLPVCVFAMDITNVTVDSELPIEVPEESAMPKPVGDKVHAQTPADWTTAYLYAWGDNGDNGGWPGAEMSKDDEGNWVGELTPGYKNVIITASDSGPQTIDLGYKGGEAWVTLEEPMADGKYDAYVRYDGFGPRPEAEWYVAGTMNEWNAKDDAYKMTKNDDGSFSLELELTAGDYSFKITAGSWDDRSFGGSGTDGNYEFTLVSDGKVIIKFDGKGEILVEGDLGEPDPVWYIALDANQWNPADEAWKMTDNGDGTFSYTFDVTPGDYELKVAPGAWNGKEVGDGAGGNYVFNVTDDCKVTIKFDGTAITHEFSAKDEPIPTTPPTTTGIGGDGGGSTPPALIIGIVATAVILIGGGAAVFFILKKKD